MDYDPDHEAAIADFLAEAGFDYAIGSVHELDGGANVHTRSHFADKPASERRALVDRYFEAGRADRFRAVRDRRASGFGRA